jgi:methylaspartate ammonia-lyase
VKYPYKFVVDGPLHDDVKHPYRESIGSGQVSSKVLLAKLTEALEAAGCKVTQIIDDNEDSTDDINQFSD